MFTTLLRHALWDRRRAHLILHVTGRCQLQCRSCFNADSETTDLDIEFIRELSRSMQGLLWLEISGGEPFLRRDLAEICTLFDVGLVSIATNGQAPRRVEEAVREIRRALEASAQLSLSVSLDGFEETHEDIRGRGTYSNALETFHRLKEIPGVRVKVNTILCEANCGTVIDFMRSVRRLDPDFHSLVLLRGSPRDETFRRPGLATLKALRDDLYRIWSTYDYGMAGGLRGRILKNYQRASFEAILGLLESGALRPPCLADRKHLVVWPDASVSFCEMLPPFGTLNHGGLAAALATEKARRQREVISQGKCDCHHNCNMLDNFFLNPRTYPELIGLRKRIVSG